MTDIETIALYGPGNLKPEDLVAGFVAREKTLAYFLNELRHQATPGASPRHHLIIGQRGMGKTTLLLRIAVAIGEQPKSASNTTESTPPPIKGRLGGNDVEISNVPPFIKGGLGGISGNMIERQAFKIPLNPPFSKGEAVNSTALPLADYFVPLTFREEQYNVINLHVFWRNCIESLLDWLEQQGRDDEAKTLEQQLNEVENAYEQDRKAEAGGSAAGRVFRQACQRLQRRPVLFLDNLDLIIDALKKHDWGLRDHLQQSDGPLVIGAAPAYPKNLSDRKAAFFDFFRITTLERLEIAEVRACLQRLAHRRGEAGTKVAAVLRRDPGRIAALTEMTGGNPRTLAVLYLLLESQAGEDAFADLEKLLDRMTPLYKARTEEAAPQARAVLDAVALNWDPITANQVARDSGLDVTAVNAQLARLENDGYVEKVEVSGSGRSGYQIVERFFNIWYLMRHGSRRLKQRVQWLTGFLRGFYSPSDRTSLARDMLRSGKHKGRADVMMALSESVDDPIYRKALSHAAGRDLLQQSDIRKRIEYLVDLRDIDPEQADMVELERQALAVKREWPEGINARSFWELSGGSLEMSAAEKRKVVEQLPGMGLDELAELTATLSKEIASLCATIMITERELEPYQEAVRNGCIHHLYDLLGVSAAALIGEYNTNIVAIACLRALNNPISDPDEIRATLKRFPGEIGALWDRIQHHPNLDKLDTTERAFYRGEYLAGFGYLSDAETAYRKAGEMNSRDICCIGAWNNLGTLLDKDPNRTQEAEKAYRRGILLDPESFVLWNNLSLLLMVDSNRREEAESAFRKTIELNPKHTTAWCNLGLILAERPYQYMEAEATYRKAIELEPELAKAWTILGDLLQDSSERFEESEDAYRKAIALDSNDAAPWNGLGKLQQKLGCYLEAEAAYRQAITLDANVGYPWNNLGILLANLSRYEEAETAYRQAITLDPKSMIPLYNLGYLLQDHLGRYEEAEVTYRQAIALKPGDTWSWNNLGNLLQAYLSRYEEAEAAYRKAIALDPNLADRWTGLGNLLQDYMGRYE
ncbi:MAG: tetratricopeptide repeat protein [Candidatus Methylumidiphilus sp.]